MVNSIEQAEEISTDLPESFYILARRFWPGPLTMIVPASRRVPRKIASDTGKVAVRLPDAPIPRALHGRFRLADHRHQRRNLAGLEACTTAADVQIHLGDPNSADRRWPGESCEGLGIPSTIIDLAPTGWKVVREGAIPVSDIMEFFES